MDRNLAFGLPTVSQQLRNLCIGLLVAYVLQLVLRNGGLDVHALSWQPFEAGFQPWQPLTRFAVQGGAGTVIFALLTLYLLGPAVEDSMPRVQLRNAVLAGALGSTLLPLLLDIAVASNGMVTGWTTLVFVLVPTLFGLTRPDGTVYLMMVIPVNGRFLLWSTAVLSALVLLAGAGSGIESGEPFGAWAATYAWWNYLGPGRRRRELKQKASNIERELRRFQVIEGGRGQGEQGRPDDEWVN